MASNTLKALSLNSRGYAARRTYGNRTTVRGMHADGVPQQRGWATPSGSMSPITHSFSVGRTDPRLLMGDPVRVDVPGDAFRFRRFCEPTAIERRPRCGHPRQKYRLSLELVRFACKELLSLELVRFACKELLSLELCSLATERTQERERTRAKLKYIKK